MVAAKSNSYVTIVNPVRGEEFWSQKEQKWADVVKSQMDIINSQDVKATWLIRFDVLKDNDLVNLLKKNPKHEVGIFLEVLPSLTASADVVYHKSNSWHDPESVFLTGYSAEDRYKIIDSFFTNFKQIFGFYPKSVGAWWIDANSLSYMNKKYGVVAALIVADQYSTDNYRIWGQYFGTPYYPFNRNTLLPAQSSSDKIPVVITQWAIRDPYNAYGKAVEESTYSVQANDYIDYHNLDIDYFNKLVDIYTKTDNRISQITVGLENSYSWSKFKSEYERQIKNVASRASKGEVIISTMSGFADQYKLKFPEISPAMTIYAQNPLDPKYKVIWFMNPYYRAGLFADQKGLRFRDIREYTNGEEPCFQKRCNRIEFKNTFVNNVDDVASGKSFYISEADGKDIKISFKISDNNEKTTVKYTDADGKDKTIEFLPRDISIDGKIYTISGLILKTNQEYYERPSRAEVKNNNPLSFIQKIWQVISNWVLNLLNIKF